MRSFGIGLITAAAMIVPFSASMADDDGLTPRAREIVRTLVITDTPTLPNSQNKCDTSKGVRRDGGSGFSDTRDEGGTFGEYGCGVAEFQDITFAFGSDELTELGRAMVRDIGLALKSKDLELATVQVIGHTDAVGDEKANKDLSERRARSVVTALVFDQGISTQRLFSEGLGESQLKHPGDPEASGNRRVELKIILPDSTASN